MQQKRKVQVIQFAIVGLCLMILISIPFVLDIAPTMARNYQVKKATAADLKTRERGLDYIIRHAGKDEKIRNAAVDLLSTTADDENFIQITKALDFAGLWSREYVPAREYLRWLKLTAERSEVKSRMLAVGYFAELADIADDTTLQETLRTLMGDVDADVRYNALVAAADLAFAAKDPAPFLDMIRVCTNDQMPGVARQAWIMLGVLGEAKSVPTDLVKLPDLVAQAAAWALMASNAAGAEEAVQAVVMDESAAIKTRAGVVFALKQGKLASTQAKLREVVTSIKPPTGVKAEAIAGAGATGLAKQTISPENTWFFQRAVLAFSTSAGDKANELSQATEYLLSMQARDITLGKADWDPLFIAGFFMRSSTLDGKAIEQLSDPMVVQALLIQPNFALGIFEGLPAGSATAKVAQDMSEPMQLAVLRASKEVDVDGLFELCSSEVDTVRDQACVIAWKRLDKQAQSDLVGRLLKDYNDNAKKSGGFLAGLTGTQSELLNKRIRDEDVWEVQQILKLGQFMQKPEQYGDKANDAQTEKDFTNFRALLMRSDIARTTVVLGLLYKKDASPLEFLLNPRGEPYLPLIDIFGTQRWWMALKEFAPADLPGIQRWADPGLIHFQIDLMRNWYLLHKRKVEWGE